uniref:Uncharacterized protein n=1 Tax=Tanacetum cinerariifolium TaxID=118510 RepID=A0A6L2NSN7_TANCI|nr:hypothetical protein [Tanacetum cinerariifolium]
MDEAFARQLEVELNANINWNDVIEQVKRSEKQYNTVMRYQALKRKPMTEAQARKNMMIYLKNMAGFKMNFFKLVKERFKSTEPKNFSDDFLLNILKIMFEKPNVEANVWRDQNGRYGLAKKYHLTHFTLEQMLNNVRLEVEEESEMSLELLRESDTWVWGRRVTWNVGGVSGTIQVVCGARERAIGMRGILAGRGCLGSYEV